MRIVKQLSPNKYGYNHNIFNRGKNWGIEDYDIEFDNDLEYFACREAEMRINSEEKFMMILNEDIT